MTPTIGQPAGRSAPPARGAGRAATIRVYRIGCRAASRVAPVARTLYGCVLYRSGWGFRLGGRAVTLCIGRWAPVIADGPAVRWEDAVACVRFDLWVAYQSGNVEEARAAEEALRALGTAPRPWRPARRENLRCGSPS